ncbi:hypothetical protein CBG04_08415 [Limosilactobacillus reuteri]|jgi:hypothetical protein|uniref:Phage protein n=1 Tax=Limosilactobacillus reuteri TaxID=1598 RepID=A0AAX2SS27_LIMRT|nr:hypothetical protein [Limosilactobacillus reuteri]MCH5378424.1 hypothetical protein [Limosilactobacillus reuteri]OCW70562.1 hypothetical protein BBP14_10225 [Limosilactobacillus reuteri]OCW71547.1 hypothetical protein BBP13_10710 [Limosilactobacillus reuteri]OYS80573.1 hypothetical protein CBG11_07000 [Limosilactobacillus reuteri]OYS82440.1 hypothetical protein CBG04_08415 [Limosilactobacillus reuteri]
MVTVAGKRIFEDKFMDTTLELTSQEIIDYGIYVLEEELTPEAYSEELPAYKRDLAMLKDNDTNMIERVEKAIEIMGIVNIYEV